MQPGCWLRATQPATADGDGGALAGTGTGKGTRARATALKGGSPAVTADGEVGRGYIESSASVATLASISSIASTSAAAMAALKARPYLVAPFVTTASAPPTPHPHASISTSTARTAPATPTRRRIAPEDDINLVEDLDVALAQIEDTQTHTKNKSQRFFWRKALRRVFQRRKWRRRRQDLPRWHRPARRCRRRNLAERVRRICACCAYGQILLRAARVALLSCIRWRTRGNIRNNNFYFSNH